MYLVRSVSTKMIAVCGAFALAAVLIGGAVGLGGWDDEGVSSAQTKLTACTCGSDCPAICGDECRCAGETAVQQAKGASPACLCGPDCQAICGDNCKCDSSAGVCKAGQPGGPCPCGSDCPARCGDNCKCAGKASACEA